MFLLLVLPALLGWSCNKDDDIRPGFTFQYHEEFEIPVGYAPPQSLIIQLKNIQTRYKELLVQYGKTEDEISGIITTRASLGSVFGDANFDFVEEASVRLYQEADPTDYIEVAYRYPVPFDPGPTLGLIPSLADSKRMLEQTRFSIETSLRLRKTTVDNFPVKLDLEFKAIYK